MRAQIHNKSQVEKMLAKLIDEKRTEIFNDVAFDIGRQMVAIDAAVLEKEFGFKEEDLRKFLKHVSAIHALLASNPLGKQFNGYDYVKHLKDTYNIDLETDKF
jgi:hypothetical protein